MYERAHSEDQNAEKINDQLSGRDLKSVVSSSKDSRRYDRDGDARMSGATHSGRPSLNVPNGNLSDSEQRMFRQSIREGLKEVGGDSKKYSYEIKVDEGDLDSDDNAEVLQLVDLRRGQAPNILFSKPKKLQFATRCLDLNLSPRGVGL